MLQEGIGLDAHADEAAAALKLEAADRTHGTRGLALGGAEAREVVLAHEAGGTLAHALDVERAEDPARQIVENGRAHGIVVNPVLVGARACGEARVEVVVDAPCPAHGDAGRQVRVEAAHPAALGAVGLRLNAHHLLHGVHARIRATRAHRRRLHLQEGLKRILKRLLHGRAVGLDLPTVEARAAIFNAKRYLHFGSV